jgi:hypothetical protein
MFQMLAVAALPMMSAFADVMSFETGDTFRLTVGGSGTSTQDCGVAHTGSCSVRLDLPNYATDGAAAGIIWNGSLGSTNSSVWALVPSSSPQLFPFLDYYVDSSRDGSIEAIPTDSLVILDESPSFTAGTWQFEVLDGSSLVHVDGNRLGLAANAFTTGNPGTLDALRATSIGGGLTWGDLTVMRARAEAGTWGTAPEPSYTAWVDDLSVSSVPEPGAIVLLGTVLAIMAATGRRKLFRR